MKVNELRLGNFINIANKGNVKLAAFKDLVSVEKAEEGYCIGIPLTEEWILSFGFERTDRDLWGVVQPVYFYMDLDNPFAITKSLSEYHLILNNYNYNSIIAYSQTYEYLKYVHQLQNMYYALTGEELNPQE